MTTHLNPYLSLKNNAREAMEFYKSVFGGELTLSTFADFHASQGADEDDLIMHSVLTSPNGLVLMASDTTNRMPYVKGTDVSISLSGEDEAELTGYWTKLSEGATITMPLEKAVWGDSFGMLHDRFGVSWLVNIGATPNA
ncbi:MAG: VOC family protein [Actinomycetota bacterium]